jgi:CHRD domain-containing protein
MKTVRIVMAGLIAVSLSMVALVAASDKGKDNDRDRDRDNRISARLVGINEVPSVSTGATGRLKATISRDEQSIDYELSFSGLQGVVAQSHIHIARRNVNGGIVLWLCQGTARAPAQVAATTPECPQEGTVTGTLTAASVTPVATQQIGLNELNEVTALIRAGAAYANVHTAPSPGGEIRGQLRVGDDDDRGRDR